MKRNGEDIIITTTGEMEAAKQEAINVSSSRAHSWCRIWHINSESKQLERITYSNGEYLSTLMGNGINFWFSSGSVRGLTILDAMVRYGNGWVKDQATRLGGTGRYTTYRGQLNRGGIEMYIYTNSFHNTKARSEISPQEFANCDYVQLKELRECDSYEASIKRAAARLQKKLCGISGCTCGSWFGQR